MARRYATIKWTESQVTRLERAVNAYNEALEKARPRYKGGLALLLPRTTTVAEEIDRIDTASQLNSRINSLNRIHRPGALDVNVARQMTNYEYHEGVVAKSVVNRWRAQRLKELGGTLRRRDGKYEPADSRTRSIINETNLMPIQYEVSPETVGNIRRQALEYSGGNIQKLRTYYINYVRQWSKYFDWTDEYHAVLDILNALMNSDTNTINNVFYSYDYYGTFDYLYDQYDRTPIAKKAKNVLRYWREQQQKWGF